MLAMFLVSSILLELGSRMSLFCIVLFLFYCNDLRKELATFVLITPK